MMRYDDPGSKVCVAVPLCRVGRLRTLLESIEATAPTASVLVVCDPELFVASNTIPNALADFPRVAVIWSRHPNKTTFPARMNLAHDYLSKWAPALSLMLAAADDITFTEGWLQPLLDAPEKADTIGLHVVGPNGKQAIGGSNKWSPHLAFRMGCSRVSPPFFPDYDHHYCDVDASLSARASGTWHYAENSKLIHHHPAFDAAPQDATYERGRLHELSDRAVWAVRKAQLTQEFQARFARGL